MVEVQTSEVDAKPTPVSLAQQWVKCGNHYWATQECTVVKQWISLFKPISEQQYDQRVPKGIV
jgi:hypothetical protein